MSMETFLRTTRLEVLRPGQDAVVPAAARGAREPAPPRAELVAPRHLARRRAPALLPQGPREQRFKV